MSRLEATAADVSEALIVLRGADDPTPARAVIASAILGYVSEPGDGVLGRIIGAVGAEWTAASLIEHRPESEWSAPLEEHGAAVGARELAAGLDRWRPRVDHAAFVRSVEQAARVRARLLIPSDAAWPDVAIRARAYGIPAVRVDGNDLVAVYHAVGEAVARARRGEGPSCVEAVTYRWGGHSMRANLPSYRTKEEELEWMEKDPVARVERRMVEAGLGELELKEIRRRVEGEMEAAVAYGTESPEPSIEVMEAAVVARPDAKWGETPCAFVTLKPGADVVTAEDIIAYCRANMAHFKAPKTVVFGPLPKTSTGKILKYELRDKARGL